MQWLNLQMDLKQRRGYSSSSRLKKGSKLTEKINKILAEISEEERQEIMDDAIQ